MAVVFLIAADFGIVRALWGTAGPGLAVSILTLPMINLLILAIPRLKGGVRPYWVGFQAAGWVAASVTAYLALIDAKWFFWPVDWMERILPTSPGEPLHVSLLIALAVIVYTTPQLLLALAVGWLLARYRVVIERR